MGEIRKARSVFLGLGLVQMNEEGLEQGFRSS